VEANSPSPDDGDADGSDHIGHGNFSHVNTKMIVLSLPYRRRESGSTRCLAEDLSPSLSPSLSLSLSA